MRSFLISFLQAFYLTLFVIFTAHNIAEYNKSFDHCEELVQQISAYGEYLKILQQHNF